MKPLYRCIAVTIVAVLVSNTTAFAGFWERKGTCASFEKTPEMSQTYKLAEMACTQVQASGTGVFQQEFMNGNEVLFSVTAENYPDTDHMEYRTKNGTAFYSVENLYDYKSCYITPKGDALRFHCFRADDE